MLGRSMASPLLSFETTARPNLSNAPPLATGSNFPDAFPCNIRKDAWRPHHSPKKHWMIHSAVHITDFPLTDDEKTKWEASREALSAFDFSVEDKDKILAKAFGHIDSPYWGEERKREVPVFETVNQILDYLRSLGLNNDDLYKLLKKFPEVLGCSLAKELCPNVKILEADWGIQGKSLRNLLLRNPKVLGYNVDCKGDCMAQCTRCWVRF